jgi:hypothetical protein
VNILDRVEATLERYPTIRYERSPESVEVHATTPDGFDVSITAADSSTIVHYDGWHEHFDTPDEALNCFMSGLTEGVRLRVFSRGTYDYKWIAELRHGGQWEPAGTVGLIIFPFWRKQGVRLLQNRHLEQPHPGDSR